VIDPTLDRRQSDLGDLTWQGPLHRCGASRGQDTAHEDQ
jgi:hypothetical protein